MAWWTDLYKFWTYAFTPDPLSKRIDKRDFVGAGVSQPGAMPDIRNSDVFSGSGGGFIRLRETNDFIDLSTATNRQSRLKEYFRLVQGVPEIDMAITTFADETCVAGNTRVATLFHGPVTIEWLAENKAQERFPVYCFDEARRDFTIGWAYDPRLVKTAKTVEILLDNGETAIMTEDHRVMLRDGSWRLAGQLSDSDELMAFYRITPRQGDTGLRSNQFPRIYTHSKGWVHERQFIDEWRAGKDDPAYERVNRILKMYMGGVSARKMAKIFDCNRETITTTVKRFGFTFKEADHLAKKTSYRRILRICPGKEVKVYDLSVEKYKNFCTDSLVMHNCQRDDKGRAFKIYCENKEVTSELEYVFFNRQMINLDQRFMWNLTKKLFVNGDWFGELIVNPDNPKDGVFKLVELPAESMYRIETTKRKVLEFQQSGEGVDFEALRRAPITQATDDDLRTATAVRFAPESILHIRIGDERNTFYPYGVSLIEPARGPAHQLRMMEDAMVVYRLVRAPERRVYYVDVGQLPNHKVEAYMQLMKDQLRKKKVVSSRGGAGASAVDERWHPPAQDEDIWMPMRANSTTRIDTLPGAENLGEIDDVVFFRNKLYMALNLPPSYFSSDDPNSTRITLSAQSVKFAKLIERLQSHIEEGIRELAERHLHLRGFPQESYDGLSIKMTSPSDWRELNRAEVTTNRINNMSSLKSSQLFSDFDILVKYGGYTEDEANEAVSRNKMQKLEDLKLQVVAQNPILLGVGQPGGQGQQEIGAQPGGPNPMPEPGQLTQMQPPEGGEMTPPQPPPPDMTPHSGQAMELPDPSPEELIKYDLEMQDYESEQDNEDIDYSDN